MPAPRGMPLDKVTTILTVHGNTPAQARRAALVIADLAGNPDDAIVPMQALGLLPSESVERKWDAVGVVHGTRSAIEWHAAQTRAQHHTLCPSCRRYVEVQGRSGKKPRLRVVEGD